MTTFRVSKQMLAHLMQLPDGAEVHEIIDEGETFQIALDVPDWPDGPVDVQVTASSVTFVQDWHVHPSEDNDVE